jgi:hypothetical protein
VIGLILSGASLWAQSYNNDAILIQKKKNLAIIKSSGTHEKKKEAVEMALKSAFDTYFNYGIEGLNEGRPLLREESGGTTTAYLERFYDDKTRRYRSFVASYEEDGNPQKLPNGMYKSTVTFEMYDDALLKDLTRNRIELNATVRLPEKSTAEIRKDVAQPTIMIVPYKQQGKSYKDMLGGNTLDYRNIIVMIQDVFRQKDYDIKDFMAVYEATERSMQFESNTSVASFDAQLLNNSGADVYVTVDAGQNTNSSGTVGSIALVAYERASGRILGSKQAVSPRYRQGTLTDLYRIASGSIAEGFLKDITKAYQAKIEGGNTLVLRISVGNNANVDLNSEISSEGGFPLSDVIRKWVRQNVHNNSMHVLGSTRDNIIFDQIQFAAKDSSGQFLDANDFALEIFGYIGNTLGISCSKRVDGNTVYITIEE